mgnify:CR=1 FL=1|tara:strand:+ start:4679 stop:6109 length:1431 start_codon:yes stop_codon:yes gene_type:complete
MANTNDKVATGKKHPVVVLGSGPGGYAAAFRMADLGMEVTLIERNRALGGVCLNVGCIPSKTLLHLAEMCHEVPALKDHGLDFGAAKLDQSKIIDFKEQVINKLTKGLEQLASARKVNVIHADAKFCGTHQLELKSKDKVEVIDFETCVIAAGSEPIKLPFIPEDERVLDSTSALELKKINGKMLIIGGGIIGCEMGTVYNAFGSDVCIVEMTNEIMPGADRDIVKPCQKTMASRGIDFRLNTKVVSVEASARGLKVEFEGANAPEKAEIYDQILVSVGRVPNGRMIDIEKAGVNLDERGFVITDEQLRTNQPHIYAIGDITSNPMLAHKATGEGRVVAEVIAGKRVKLDAACIPSVAYTDPEVAWVGATATELKAKGVNFKKGVFPWLANGRSLCLGRSEGKTIIYYDTDTGRVLGGGIVGKVAGDLIGVIGFAIEMGADIHDIAMTVFPHPTLVETVGQAAEMAIGEPVDLLPE